MDNNGKNHSRIAILPPIIIGVPFVAGMMIQKIHPIWFPYRWIGITLGVLCIFPAVVLLGTAYAAFWRNRTSMLYTRTSRNLIVDGPFRFSRNPLFLGLLLFYAGFCLLTGASWPLLFLPVVVVLLKRVVIIPEERYLEKRFGSEYCDYKYRVNRWL